MYFLKPHMCLYLRTKFEVWRIILESLREGALPQNEPLKSPPRLGLKASIIKVTDE